MSVVTEGSYVQRCGAMRASHAVTITPTSEPSLQVQSESTSIALTASSIDLRLGAAATDPTASAISLAAPQGYTLQVARPTGTTIGLAIVPCCG